MCYHKDKDPSSESRGAMKTVYLLRVKKIGSCRIPSSERSKRDVKFVPDYRHLFTVYAMCITLGRKPSKAKTYFASALE
jgi:hypothetical protein